MLYDPHEQRYYEVPVELAQLHDEPPSAQEEEDYDAGDEMEVSPPLRPRKRRREDDSPSPPHRRRRRLYQ